MGLQTQYLEWHGQQWRVRVKVPAVARSILGKGKLVAPLHTADLKEANERKWTYVTQLKARIAEAVKAAHHSDPLTAEALKLRLAPHDDDGNVAYEIDEHASQIERTQGKRRAVAFSQMAGGLLTPLDHHVDAFAEHRGYRMKSKGDFERALGWLRDWLKARSEPLALEAVSRLTAGKFIAESLVVCRSGAKAVAYLGFLRQYWKWLIDKGHIASAPENPWAGQSLPSGPKRSRNAEHDGGKRPFSDDELKKLLEGETIPLMADIMYVAALSGMRLEEICQLYVRDCDSGNFNVWAGKTDNARRTVPIHSKLAGIVKRRCVGKEPDAFLFDEIPPPNESRETRSDPIAKRFTRYRRLQGVDERPNGKAKSNVDFHSFRRWFVRSARNAIIGGAKGFDPWTLVWVVGHSDADMPKSLDLSQRGYAGQDAEKAKRALVEAVRLPN